MLSRWPAIMREFEKRSDKVVMLHQDCKTVSTEHYVVIGNSTGVRA
jgi:hypothetical protein